MLRRLTLFLTAVATIGLTALGPPTAYANPANVANRNPAAGASAASTTAAACAFPTVRFNGAAYCPASIVGVRNTVYGIGTRVVLKGVTVTAVTPNVTVAVWTSPPCPPGNFCGQSADVESLNRVLDRNEPAGVPRRARPVRPDHHRLDHPGRLRQDRLLPHRLVLTTPAAKCPANPG